ncbi:MAG: hypothetical protein OXI52_03345, partial [Caldilineaceae bacterium]|nr:hypothetical protein [Caldilineaceae bacterium]
MTELKLNQRHLTMRLLIDYGAVGMETGFDRARGVGMALGGVCSELDADAGCVGDDEEAAFLSEGGLDDFALGRFVFANGIFLEGEVGDAGGELDAGSCADGAEGVVGDDLDVEGLG